MEKYQEKNEEHGNQEDEVGAVAQMTQSKSCIFIHESCPVKILKRWNANSFYFVGWETQCTELL